MAVKHAKTSAKSDGGDSTLVRPSDWNADHVGTNDHDHTAASTQGGVLPFATPAIALGSAAAAGSGTSPIRHNSTIAAFDSTAPGDVDPTQASGTGSVAYAARRDHRHKGAGALAVLTSDVAIANTETRVLAAVLAANYLAAGTTFRIRAAGTLTSGATGGTGTWRIRIGTTTLTGNVATSVSPVNANSQTNVGFSFDALVTVRASGSSGTIIGECMAMSQVGFTAPIVMASSTTATVAVDTTAADQRLELTCISGNAGTTITFRVASIELVKA